MKQSTALMRDDNAVETIDMTPEWQGLLPAMLSVLYHGDDKSRHTMEGQFALMAKGADRWNKHCKKQNGRD